MSLSLYDLRKHIAEVKQNLINQYNNEETDNKELINAEFYIRVGILQTIDAINKKIDEEIKFE